MPEPNINLISNATKKNWNRLGVENTSSRLTSRANKRMSAKNIIPLEYAASSAAAEWMRRLLEQVRQNRWNVPSVMYSLCINLLHTFSLHELPHVQSAFSDLPKYDLIEPLLSLPLPENERDLLGLAYQSLLSEGARNQKGAYYTPPAIVQDMTHDLHDFSGTCIDPCCGSGAFLLTLLKEGIPPAHLFGCDIDPVAVMLARCNLLIACRPSSVIPAVVCADFLRDELPFPQNFDLIITNPPWGALSDKMDFGDFSSAESFSCFLHTACQKLSQNGSIRFLLPEAFLNVRAHRSLRRYLLEHKSVRRIRFYEDTFSGVTTRCICAEIRHAAETDLIHLCGAHIDAHISASFYRTYGDFIIRPLNAIDCGIIEKMYAHGVHTLKNSTWALGIVTGDNRRMLRDTPQENCEPIYTGREIGQYTLKPARRYIHYDRAAFQQAAPDECYRAEEKLVYRFICDRPVFALDTSKALCLNSANILIPRVSQLSVYTVLALLNCAPLQYLYMQNCGGVKVLKGYLEKLPLPALNEEQDAFLCAQVQKILSSDAETRHMLHEELNEYLFALYGFSEQEIQRIRDITTLPRSTAPRKEKTP